jgi:hypothetical protein
MCCTDYLDYSGHFFEHCTSYVILDPHLCTTADKSMVPTFLLCPTLVIVPIAALICNYDVQFCIVIAHMLV